MAVLECSFLNHSQGNLGINDVLNQKFNNFFVFCEVVLFFWAIYHLKAIQREIS
jgi:hypothetical protein